MRGCSNCRYCKCYPGGYYIGPDEYECTSELMMNGTGTDLGDEVLEDIFTRVWENGEEWSDEEQLCPGWEEEMEYEDY